MAYQGQYYEISDFSGGYAGNLPDSQIGLNQAADLDNIVIKSGGKGFRSRLGDTEFGVAVLVIQDLTYTAVAANTAGESVTVAYTTGATAGAEVVTVTGNAISIQIESGVSTATQVKTAFDAVAAAIALATCTISGTAGDAQTAPVTATALAVPAMNSGVAVQGLGYYLQADGDKWLVAVCGNKIYKSDSLDGVMDDITDSLTINAGATRQWDLFTFNDQIIGFGGLATAPDAPWKWTGTGNASALGGSSSSFYGGFAANNRVFGFRTAAAPSTIAWSIIGDATDWTGTGSGSAVVGSLSDNEHITGASVLSTNYVLVFKENSTYQMVISSTPFPIYTLFDNVGAAGKKAIVSVDGECYFITSQGEMKSTNGESLTSYPPVADDLWDAVLPTYYPFIVGYHHKGSDFDWIVWCVTTTGTTNNKAIIWDLANKCWLQCTTGHKYNAFTTSPNGVIYTGNYAGYILIPETSARYADASESAPGTITSYWQSGWLNPDNLNKITHVRKFTILLTPKASGSVTLAYGFDGIANGTSTTFSQVATSTETYCQESAMLTGRGNTFEYKVSLASAAIDMEVQRIILAGKTYGQKGQAEN